MTIEFSDIRLFQSINNVDSGGGDRSTVEILDGFLNNLFTGISRVDALLGEQSIKGVHVVIDSDSAENYLDSHILINRVPDSDFIRVFLLKSPNRVGEVNQVGIDMFDDNNRVYSLSNVISHTSTEVTIDELAINISDQDITEFSLLPADFALEVDPTKSIRSTLGSAQVTATGVEDEITVTFNVLDDLNANNFTVLFSLFGDLIRVGGFSGTELFVDRLEEFGGNDIGMLPVSFNIVSNTVIVVFNSVLNPTQLAQAIIDMNRTIHIIYESDNVDGAVVTDTFPIRENFNVLEIVDNPGPINSIAQLETDLIEVEFNRLPEMDVFSIGSISNVIGAKFVSDDVIIIFQEDERVISAFEGTVQNTQADITYVDVVNINDNQRLDRSNFSIDFETGDVTFNATINHVDQYGNPLDDTSDYSLQWRISEMNVVDRIQGLDLITKNPIVGTYTNAKVSSVILLGDLVATNPLLFTQEIFNTSDPVWADERIGDNTVGQYNISQYPIGLSNSGSINERWGIRFNNSTSVNIFGERTGTVLQNVNIATQAVIAPINPLTNTPYFTIQSQGFGGGWNQGNIIRFNTTGASHHFFAGRIVLPGAEANEEDSFQIEVRGDIG